MVIWNFIHKNLQNNQKVALLYVVQSKDSSPGRQGFKMAVSKDAMRGSIGGGIMEHKLVELAKDLLRKNEPYHTLRQQIHRKDSPKNQSGMICSGEQTVVISILDTTHKVLVAAIVDCLGNKQKGCLQIDQKGLHFIPAQKITEIQSTDEPFIGHFHFQYKSKEKWCYKEEIGYQPTIHIIGAGHVGLALSKAMHGLDFRVILYDDREGLNTMEDNHFVHKKIITPYGEIARYITESPDDYVVIMTFGYRADEVVLRQLINKKIAYLGMMGSKAKIKKMFESLKNDGFSAGQLGRVFAPVGLPIKSKTPAEIAISVAGQIVSVKNA